MKSGRLLHILTVILMAAAQPVLAVDPPHLSDGATGNTDCSLCHTTHDAPGGALTNAEGNANLCQSCHVVGGTAELYALTESDQALPGPGLPDGVSPGGTSHRWDSGPSGHVALGTPNTSTGTIQSGGDFTGRFATTYTITITTAGDSDSAVFSWVDTQGGGEPINAAGADVGLGLEGVTVTFTDGESSPSFELGDQWYVHVLTDLNTPSDPSMLARLEDGKIMCSTCHHQHSQELTPFDPDAPAYGGAGTGYQCVGGADDGLPCDGGCPGGECRGRHFQRISNENAEMCLDCHSTRNVGSLASQGEANLSHPVGVPIPGGDYQAPSSLPLDASSNVACLSCHDMHDPGGFKGLPDDGTLLRLASTSLCEECHTLAGVGASHLNTDTGVLWPGGEYGSTFPEITDTAKRGSCVNCHQPHGYPDDATPSQDYATLLVENASADICFTCHDANGPSAYDVYTQFNGATNYQATAAPGALINQRHDVSVADQVYSSSAVACANCHNPHKATSSQKIIDPDTPATAYAKTYDTRNGWGVSSESNNNEYVGSGIDDAGNPVAYDFTYYGTTADANPMNPIGCVAQAATIGPAIDQEPVIGGNDTAESNEAGTYTGTEDQTYSVLVSTGGAPGTAQITVTSTGADSSGPTTVTAFGTPVTVGNFDVTITFTDIGTPSSIDPATCTTDCDDDTATSGGTYTGPADGTYTLSVTTAGAAGEAVLTCTSGISGDACNPSTTYAWPGNGTPISIGSYGVEVTIDDADNRANRQDLAVGEEWQISVTAATPGDGQLAQNDRWTISVTAATAGCSTDPEPDMISFCLVCHDTSGGFDPVSGVTMSPGLVNIADGYSSGEQHGRNNGNDGGNGFMKAPWQDVAGTDTDEPPDGFSDLELTNPYAALQCDLCHDGHGSDNIYHLKTSISVRGQQMSVGGGPGSGFQAAPFTAVSDHSPGDTTYRLPCFDGGGNQVSCSTPGSSQQDLKWGAWCSFCHDMQTHGQDESNTCQAGHRHGGTRY